MLNQDDFINRLTVIFNHYNLTAALFADEIKVQRSSISHLLSGRNKPSLEFVLKVCDSFKEISIEWLLYGKGNFPQEKVEPVKENTSKDLFSDIPPTKIETNTEQKKTTQSEIERIVVFYSNGQFKEYTP